MQCQRLPAFTLVISASRSSPGSVRSQKTTMPLSCRQTPCDTSQLQYILVCFCATVPHVAYLALNRETCALQLHRLLDCEPGLLQRLLAMFR